MPCVWLPGKQLDPRPRLLCCCGLKRARLWVLAAVAAAFHQERAQLFVSARAYQSCRQKTSDCPEHQGPERIHNQGPKTNFPKGLSEPSLYTFPD